MKTGNQLISEITKSGGFDFLAYIFFRWEDEEGYEDWNDYIDAAKKKLYFLEITKFSSRPFALSFSTAEGELTVQVKKVKDGIEFIAK